MIVPPWNEDDDDYDYVLARMLQPYADRLTIRPDSMPTSSFTIPSTHAKDRAF